MDAKTNPARYGWLCFHCGEHFKQNERDKAEAHFGPTPEWNAACIERRITEDTTLVDMSRRARLETVALMRRVYDAEAETEIEHAKRNGLHRFPARTVDEAYNKYESMEGRALAAEAIIKHLEELMPDLVRNVREIV